MTIRVATSVRNAQVDAVKALVDGGAGPAKLRIYTGGQPAGGPGVAATGTLLAEFTLNDPAFAATGTGSAALDVDPALTDTGITDGTAGWGRVLDSNDVALIDGSVTATGGGGNFTIDDTSVVTGGLVTVTSGTLSAPASGS